MRRIIFRWRRLAVPAILLGLVVALCSRLQLAAVKVPYQSQSTRNIAFQTGMMPMTVEFFDRGWPWPYLDSVDVQSVPAGPTASQPMVLQAAINAEQNAADLQSKFAIAPTPSITRNSHVIRFAWLPFLADLLICLAPIALIVLLVSHRYRRHQFGWRFSLRAMLVGIAIIGAVLGWSMHHYTRWKRQNEFFKRFPGVQLTKYEPGPRWARCLFSPDDMIFLCTPQEITIGYARFASQDDKTEFLSLMRELPPVSTVRVGDDDTLEAIGELPTLRTLTLVNFQFTDAGLQYLAASPSLEELCTSGHFTKASDAGVRAVCQIKTLRRLSLFFWSITDASIESILQAPQLEELDLAGCKKLTDIAARRLAIMPHLKKLTIDGPPELSHETIAFLRLHIDEVVEY